MTALTVETIRSIEQEGSPHVQLNGQWKASDVYEFPASGFQGIPDATMKNGALAMVDTDTNWDVGYRLVRKTDDGIWDPVNGPGRTVLHYILGADTEDNGSDEAAPPDFTSRANFARAVSNLKVLSVNREATTVAAKEYTEFDPLIVDFDPYDGGVYKSGVYTNKGTTNHRETFGWQGTEVTAATSTVRVLKPGTYLVYAKYRSFDLATQDTDCEEVILDSPTTGSVYLHMAAQTGGSSITTTKGTRYHSARTGAFVRIVLPGQPFTFRVRTRVATAMTSASTPTRHLYITVTRLNNTRREKANTEGTDYMLP